MNVLVLTFERCQVHEKKKKKKMINLLSFKFHIPYPTYSIFYKTFYAYKYNDIKTYVNIYISIYTYTSQLMVLLYISKQYFFFSCLASFQQKEKKKVFRTE